MKTLEAIAFIVAIYAGICLVALWFWHRDARRYCDSCGAELPYHYNTCPANKYQTYRRTQ